MADLAHLQAVAAQLIGRVHDDDPDANGRWLVAQLPNPADWFRLCFALAAAVPTDAPWSELIAWTAIHSPKGVTTGHANELSTGPYPERAQQLVDGKAATSEAYEAVLRERFGGRSQRTAADRQSASALRIPP